MVQIQPLPPVLSWVFFNLIILFIHAEYGTMEYNENYPQSDPSRGELHWPDQKNKKILCAVSPHASPSPPLLSNKHAHCSEERQISGVAITGVITLGMGGGGGWSALHSKSKASGTRRRQ